MRNRSLPFLALILGFFLSSPSSATYIYLNYSGTIVADTDTSGILGVENIDILNKPFSYNLYYNTNSLVDSGPLGYDYSVIRVSGNIAGINIPFQMGSGQISRFDYGLIYSGGPTGTNYPSFYYFRDETGYGTDESLIRFEKDTGIVDIPVEISSFGGGLISSPVPEPANWLMMLIGFIALGTAIRLRKSLKVTETADQLAL